MCIYYTLLLQNLKILQQLQNRNKYYISSNISFNKTKNKILSFIRNIYKNDILLIKVKKKIIT